VKISIITVSYNAAATIEDTIQSVLNQSYKNIEYVIIDGGSSDGTQAIIEKYSDRISYYVSEPDGGIYFGMNKGVIACTGDFIGILNADDVYASKTVISDVVELLQTAKTNTLYGDLEYVTEKNLNVVLRKWTSGIFERKKFLRGWMPPHPTFFVQKELYLKYGSFNTSFKISADYELMLRFLFNNGLSAVYLPQTLIKMRVGGVSNSSLKNRLQANREDRRAWKINNLTPKWYTLFAKPASKVMQFLK
jgi:glycosyltransferase involved in cell wall biosynthesis